MSSIVIRSFEPSDLAACQELFTKAHRDYGNPMIFIEHVLKADMLDIEKSYLQVPNGHWWIAVSTDDNRIVGQIAVLPMELGDRSTYAQAPVDQRDQTCELLRMAVTSDVQRQGVGKKLLSTLSDFAREKGFQQIHLTTAKNMYKGKGFYEKNGFIKGRVERYSLDGILDANGGDLKKVFETSPKRVVFESESAVPEEDQQRFHLSPSESPYLYVQHYFLPLN